ncbi:MAG: AAA family ATPase [Acidimicrobiales bacterium]
MTVDDRPKVPLPCVMVLVGPSGSGKSTWAATQFGPDEIVASDRLRAAVGRGEDDLEATDDAFALLDRSLEQRARRRLTTVVDTLDLDALAGGTTARSQRPTGSRASSSASMFRPPSAERAIGNEPIGFPRPR